MAKPFSHITLLVILSLAGQSRSNAQVYTPLPVDAATDAAGDYVTSHGEFHLDPQQPCPQCDVLEGAGEGITVSLLNPANRLKVRGGADVLMLFNTSRPSPSGLPLFLFPDSPFGNRTNTFDLHARQSYVGAEFFGPDLGEFKTGAQILTFLQNDRLTTDNYGLLVYYAYGELKNDDWRFAAGLQQDVFNPVSPTVVYLTKMYATGNTGAYRGQLRLERFLQDGDSYGTTIQVAVSEPLQTLVTDNVGRVTEDNGWPNVEGRVELGFGPRCDIRGSQVRALEVGVSGIVGQFRTSESLLINPPIQTARAVIDTWGVGADFEWRPNEMYGARGEFFYGDALGAYNGGVLQSFNSVTLQEIRSTGWFAEVFYYLTDAFHVHVGYGIDDPRDRDLAVTQIRRNETWFANFVWDVSKSVQLGLEVDYRETRYTQFLPNVFLDSEAAIIATRFLWRF